MKKNNSGKAHVNILIVALAIVASVWLVIGQPAPPPSDTNEYLAVDELPGEAKSSLQLRRFLFITPTPLPTSVIPSIAALTPTPTPENSTQIVPLSTPIPPSPTRRMCNLDNGVPNPDENCICIANLLECQNNFCTRVFDNNLNQVGDCDNHPMKEKFDEWCQNQYLAPQDGIYCIAKPIIYLYPEQEMLVDVKVTTPGEIFISDPLYPDGGWQDVLAYPNGNLLYKGTPYRELFYESTVSSVKEPSNGITLTSKNVSSQLKYVLHKLGLSEFELNEFIEFWEPRLLALNTPFIQFSLIEKAEKERIDHVTIDPEPDTRIELLVYFKGLKTPYSGNPLIIPSTPPERIGFTMVEWGGTIGENPFLY